MEKLFTHLHVHTEYSLLDGASKIKELVAYAKELGMNSLAITDHGVMYGVVNFYQECVKQGIKPIIGCEIYMVRDSHFKKEHKNRDHLILLAENDVGYHNLMQIVSAGYLEGFYYKPRVDKDVLRAHSEGLICLSACVAGEVPKHILDRDMEGARRAVEEHIEIFGKENYFLELQNHDQDYDPVVNDGLRRLAKEYDLGVVATNDLHYVRREDAAAQDVLLCIQTGAKVDEIDRMRMPNDSFYLKSYDEMAELFPDCPEALANTQKIAERCEVKLEFGHLLLPEFPVPDGYNETTYLRKLCEEALPRRYPEVTQAVRDRLEFELKIINDMGYDAYFLIVWDFINYCREQDIPVGPGRGSAAGSVVAYLLHITNIEPLHYRLLFERFLNPERVSMPDIDTDFCYKRRDEVLEYVVRRYGADRVAQIVTFGTLQARAAVRDVARSLRWDYQDANNLAKKIPRELGNSLSNALQSRELREIYDNDPKVHQLFDLSMKVEGLPRNSGTHAAGVIIAPKDLRELVPLQKDFTQEDDVKFKGMVTMYDKDKVEELGLLKMDFLGLRTLTVIDECMKFVRASTGEVIDIDNIPLEDAETCAMLRRGETECVFQLESAGITKLVMDLAPTSFEDLIPLVALYRPGPLGTGMAEDFIAGRHGQRTAVVLHPLMEPILEETYGVILYQEQVMQITSALAGFTLGQADIMRRAMGKKKASVLASMRKDFVEGAKKEHNIDEVLSEKIFDLLQHFAGYGFNKSHSVAYALVAYQTAYLKAHWPVQYMAAYLNSVITDAEKLAKYIGYCRKVGIDILPPDVNESGLEFTVHRVDGKLAIRFGLSGIKGLGEAVVSAIMDAREQDGPFQSLSDYCNRVNRRCVNSNNLANLIMCGAMDSFGYKRAQLIAVKELAIAQGAALQRDGDGGQLGLFAAEEIYEASEIVYPPIPEYERQKILEDEKALLGFYVTGHPLDEYRAVLRRYMPLAQFSDENGIRDGQSVKVAGIITECNIRLTKKGDTMALLRLEDFSGSFPVIVFSRTYRMDLNHIGQDNIVAVEGFYNQDERESKIIAQAVRTLSKEVPHAVELRVDGKKETPEVQRQLARIFQRYKGKDAVFLRLMGSRRVIKTTEDYWVDSTCEGFAEDVQELLGAGCIKNRLL